MSLLSKKTIKLSQEQLDADHDAFVRSGADKIIRVHFNMRFISGMLASLLVIVVVTFGFVHHADSVKAYKAEKVTCDGLGTRDKIDYAFNHGATYLDANHDGIPCNSNK